MDKFSEDQIIMAARVLGIKTKGKSLDQIKVEIEAAGDAMSDTILDITLSSPPESIDPKIEGDEPLPETVAIPTYQGIHPNTGEAL